MDYKTLWAVSQFNMWSKIWHPFQIIGMSQMGMEKPGALLCFVWVTIYLHGVMFCMFKNEVSLAILTSWYLTESSLKGRITDTPKTTTFSHTSTAINAGRTYACIRNWVRQKCKKLILNVLFLLSSIGKSTLIRNNIQNQRGHCLNMS